MEPEYARQENVEYKQVATFLAATQLLANCTQAKKKRMSQIVNMFTGLVTLTLLTVYGLYIPSVFTQLTAVFPETVYLHFFLFALFKLHILQLYQSYFLIQESHYTGGRGRIRTYTGWLPHCGFEHLGWRQLHSVDLSIWGISPLCEEPQLQTAIWPAGPARWHHVQSIWFAHECSARLQAADKNPVQKICTIHGPAGVEVSAGTVAAPRS